VSVEGDEERGGGASRSTVSAAGTSTATDVALDRHLTEKIQRETYWIDRLYTAENAHLREVNRLQREADQLAIAKALEAAKELAEKHNDLIRTGEKKDETYATRADMNRLEQWQSRLTGAILLVSLIGVTNLVKVWSG
jgi:hypothetical protein